MEADWINLFVKAALGTFESLVGVTPEQETPRLKTDAEESGEVTAMIGFSGADITGSMSLSFPVKTILGIYNSMMGESQIRIGSEVQELVGEMALLTARTAGKELAARGLAFHLSVPTISVGRRYSQQSQSDTPALEIGRAHV